MCPLHILYRVEYANPALQLISVLTDVANYVAVTEMEPLSQVRTALIHEHVTAMVSSNAAFTEAFLAPVSEIVLPYTVSISQPAIN